MRGKAIHINGIVQGVGFRPFVYNLALRHGLAGWVRNTSEGVDIRVDGSVNQLEQFIQALNAEAPPLAHIDALIVRDCSPEAFTKFEIRHSEKVQGAAQPVSPDIAICEDCVRELRTPDDPRYRYPFINCTNCGPRFTLIQDIPYDRPMTTMADFAMCTACAGEYADPLDRRFHAQPIACASCGPHVWLETAGNRLDGDPAIAGTITLLKQGSIVAIKGLGGFHIACDATNPSAVATLRQRKHRADKPFALMMGDIDQIKAYCHVSSAEAALLQSPAAPIVLLDRRNQGAMQPAIAATVAPNQRTFGVMLPYTPLHLLLFDGTMPPLIMTSGNLVDEPIVTKNMAAREQLATLADAFLMHNRDIHIRTDDSVMRLWRGVDLPLRRSRGYVPFPIRLPVKLPPILAVGGEMKNTFCITRGGYAFMSHHIGEMSDYATLQSFKSGIDHFERLFRAEPVLLVHDLHPDYLTTRYAQERASGDGIPIIEAQHHHAHVTACMAENGLSGDKPVIGVCFDGTGYGPDGTIWGGEFLLADYRQFERVAHFKPMPLPGGDTATRKPARIAYAYLLAGDLLPADDLQPVQFLSRTELNIVRQQVIQGINTPRTSSVGRLFDAVASILGICHETTYEGQAAIELEACVDSLETGTYTFPSEAETLDPEPLLEQIIADVRAGIPVGVISARFHNTLATIVTTVCRHIADQTGIHDVVLSGGVFQNTTLLSAVVPRLEAARLNVLTHRYVPPNDGGLALGQAMIGYMQWIQSEGQSS